MPPLPVPFSYLHPPASKVDSHSTWWWPTWDSNPILARRYGRHFSQGWASSSDRAMLFDGTQ